MGEYINAVLLPSLTNQSSQILTQLPLPATVTDFWRLVTQYNVSLIAAFELDSDDPTIGAYIPSGSGVPLQCGPFEIKITSGQSNELWEETVLLALKQKKRKPSLTTSSLRTQEHRVTHLKCTKCDFDPGNILTFIQKLRSHRQNDKSRILFMCRNGALYSGLVCVLTLLLDRINTDHQVSIPLAVGTVKTIRPQVIPTLDQYRTLYQALNLYCETDNTYSNCADVTSNTKQAVETGVTNTAFVDNDNNSENVYANF
ncbi:unnamed protein product [Candidula unifasciata]|uniref:Tyrosine-protein phosphatase domain-containing protein n=1 Tax=Candidula unifasciata TaxID=100452 RepID=A0A8S3YQT5_9EUPU|nr:unnamed protein product [Candidula unifasciata]